MNLVVKISLLTLCGMALSCSRQAADPVSPDGPSEDGKLPSVTLTTFAGSDTQEGYANGKGTAAQFCTVNNLTLDESGNLYLPDYNNQAIRQITPDGTVSTYIGMGTGYNKDCRLSQAKVFWPSHVAFDPHSQQLLFADHSGESLCLVTTNNYVYDLTHHLVSADYADVSPGSQHSVDGMVVNKRGEVFTVDKNNHCVRKMVITWP